MNRRTFLAAAGAGLSAVAGCTSPTSSGVPTTAMPTTDDGSGTTTRTDGSNTTTTDGEGDGDAVDLGDRGIGAASVVDLETAPRTYALSPLRYRSDDGAEIRMRFESTATADHPARVVASLTNGNEFENTFRLDWTPPFGRLRSDQPHPMGGPRWAGDHTYRATLALAPTADHDLVENPPAVERAEDGYWRLADDGGQWLPERVRLAPGETVRGEYAVVGHREGAGDGRPPGVYEFSRGQEGSVRIVVWDTDAPGPDGESRFAGESVPALSDDSVAWYHEADATTPTFVRPSTERATLPAEVEFTFLNRSRESTSCGHWDLYKLVDGEWFHVGPDVQTADCRVLGPGGAKRWTLHAFGGESVPCDDAAVYGHLGGGRYAAVAGYGHDTARSAAMVELVGDAVTVTPTDDVTAERSDGTVTVTAPEWEDGEHPPSATLTATRTGAADQTLVPEQVMRRRSRALRNTLAFFEGGVERVVLRTDEHVAQRAVGYESDVVRVQLDGQAYELRLDRQEES